MQDPQLPVEQSQVAVHDPDTQDLIPKGTASMVGWVKATVRSVYPEKGDRPSPLINAKWATQDEAADRRCMQAIRDRLYDDPDIYMLTIPVTQIVVSVEKQIFGGQH